MTAEINEFFKTCRLYYRMLMTICVAALLFAIAPSDTQRLQQAIQEADLVSKIDFPRLFNKGLRDYEEVASEIDKITTVMHSAGVTYVNTEYQTLFGNVFLISRDDATIDSLRSYILQEHSSTSSFYIRQVNDSWLKELKQKISISKADPKNLERLEAGSDSIQLRWKQRTHDSYPMTDFQPKLRTKRIEVKVDLVKVIQKDSKYRQLVQGRKDNRPIVFPRLHEFWQEVRDLKPRDAISHLAVRKAYTKDNIAFLGLSIPAYLAGIVVPLAIFIILLHLHLYMRIFSKLMKAKEDISHKQIFFPWLPLFTDQTSKILTFIYNPLLPLIANILILLRTFSTEYLETSLIAILMTLAVAILGWLLYKKTRKLHLLV